MLPGPLFHRQNLTINAFFVNNYLDVQLYIRHTAFKTYAGLMTGVTYFSGVIPDIFPVSAFITYNSSVELTFSSDLVTIATAEFDIHLYSSR